MHTNSLSALPRHDRQSFVKPHHHDSCGAHTPHAAHHHHEGSRHGVHRCGAHAPGRARPATASRGCCDTFTPAKPAPDADLKESCACCGGGQLDLDELAGLRPAETHAHHSDRWVCLPHGPQEWLVSGLTLWLAVPGLVFGIWNTRQAWTTLRGLKAKIALTAQRHAGLLRQAVGVAHKDRIPLRQALKNVEAQERTLGASQSQNRFIAFFAGILPTTASSLVVASLCVLPLALLGTAALTVYCAAHAVRYLVWDLPRTAAKLEMRADLPPMADRGVDVYKAKQRDRRWVLIAASAGFAVYGAGAALMIGAGLAVPGLAVAGTTLFLAGVVTVLYLNNTHIKKIFFDNRETHLVREELGSKESQVRLLATLHDEQGRVGVLRTRLRKPLGGLTLLDYLSIVGTVGLAYGWRRKVRTEQQIRRFEEGATDDMRPEVLTFLASSARAEATRLREQVGELERRHNAAVATHANLQDVTHWRREKERAEEALAGADAVACEARRLRSSRAVGQADMLRLLWDFLASHGLCDEVVATAASRLGTKALATAAFWAAGDGLYKLDANALCEALDTGKSRSAARHATALLAVAHHFLLNEYPNLLEHQAGALVDHLAQRALRRRARRAASLRPAA